MNIGNYILANTFFLSYQTTRSVPIILSFFILISGGLTWSFWPQQSNITATEYESTIQSLIDEVRAGNEKWNEVLIGLGFDSDIYVDLCAPIYAEIFREIGRGFIQSADEFDKLVSKNKELNKEILEFDLYQTYFEVYGQIGKDMENFANNVENGQYDKAIELLDGIIIRFENLAPIN